MARILVIDDDATLVSTFSRLLRADGHDVRDASDGEAALRMLERDAADLVLTDVYMPGMDGIQCAIRLGRLPARPKVIAVSGGGWRGKVDLLEIVARLGADRTLAKPCKPAELLDAVNAILRAAEGPSG